MPKSPRSRPSAGLAALGRLDEAAPCSSHAPGGRKQRSHFPSYQPEGPSRRRQEASHVPVATEADRTRLSCPQASVLQVPELSLPFPASVTVMRLGGRVAHVRRTHPCRLWSDSCCLQSFQVNQTHLRKLSSRVSQHECDPPSLTLWGLRGQADVGRHSTHGRRSDRRHRRVTSSLRSRPFPSPAHGRRDSSSLRGSDRV